ncbi:phosphatidylglycerol:prolipoprotein diacylglycerol transferase [Clostridium pascui]|uniref:prolipoprotein diacylglyceryl transferase n=1 Tax=Clostridium pascui TaxID=46609 RepID=UPI00311C8BB0|nr:phosphatidylglycerol:prolipoprotein diacylglycerol transferase [Clostridium pascui]
MNPIAFNIFGLDVRWYGIFIATGILIGVIFSKYTCKLKSIDYEKMQDIVFIALPFAIIGARLYYVLFNLNDYDTLFEAINIREGGLAIHGGVIGAFLSAWIYTKNKNLSFIKYADAAVPWLIFAQALGRWGNFFNGEAHGGEVTYEFISRFPQFIQKGMFIEGSYYHPTFLYESLWNLMVFFILIYLLKRESKDGVVLATYIGMYSLARFFIEGLRTDSLMFGPIRIAQLVSLIGILASIVILVIIKNKKIR